MRRCLECDRDGLAGARRKSGAPGRQIVEKARGFIEAHYEQDITLEDVARAVFLSPNYFSSLFKKVADTGLPIKEIVARSGFWDYNYFNRTFRARAGGDGQRPVREIGSGARGRMG